MHRSYGLQGSLKRRCKHPSPTSINGYRAAKKLLSQSPAKRPTFAFADESGYTLGSAQRIAHNGSHGETEGVSDGGRYHYPRTVLRGSETLRGQGVERRTLPLLGLGRVCSRRTQKAFGTAMRLCASLSRGVAAPLGCVIFFASAEIAVCTSCAQGFLRVRGMGGITTLGALCVLLKCRTAACQSGSFAVFWGRVGVVPRTIPVFLRTHRIFCRQLQLQTLLRYGTINPRNWEASGMIVGKHPKPLTTITY